MEFYNPTNSNSNFESRFPIVLDCHRWECKISFYFHVPHWDIGWCLYFRTNSFGTIKIILLKYTKLCSIRVFRNNKIQGNFKILNWKKYFATTRGFFYITVFKCVCLHPCQRLKGRLSAGKGLDSLINLLPYWEKTLINIDIGKM